MRTTVLFLLLIGVAILSTFAMSPSSAQVPAAVPAATRVAVCDVVEVFNNYERAKDLTAKLNLRRKGIQAENKKRKNAIDEIGDELNRLKEGGDEYEKRLSEMQRLTIDRKAWLQFQEARALREHHRLTKAMYEEIIKAIEAEAKSKGYDLVIYAERGGLRSTDTPSLLQEIAQRKVLYFADRVDITSTVLARLNRTYRPIGQ